MEYGPEERYQGEVSSDEIANAFQERFGARPDIVAVAPGRVNLIGEHTDYNDGFVFPAAIDREIWVAARRIEGPSSLVSQQLGPAPVFDAATVAPGMVESWSTYGAGMAWAIRSAKEVSVPNVQALVGSELPMGSGVSSSAALEMAFGVVFNELSQAGIDNREMALIAQRCENEFVGVNCGIMDQMASALGRAGHAMFLDTRSLEIRYVAIPEALSIVICDTQTPRALSDSAYNERRSQCQQAAESLGVVSLRDADAGMLRLCQDRMSDVVYRRAQHVISENQRCLDFVEALLGNDLEAIGSLIRASHVSLRDDYEVSSPALDAMAESCWDAPGTVGARMTGAGFGGACVALVQAESVEPFMESIAASFARKTGGTASLTPCHPADGARSISV